MTPSEQEKDGADSSEVNKSPSGGERPEGPQHVPQDEERFSLAATQSRSWDEPVQPAEPPRDVPPAAGVVQPDVHRNAADASGQYPPAQPAAHANPPTNTNAGLIVLQWLTYAFWGWTILALSILTATVVGSLVANADTGGFTPFGIAAVLVLLPISYVCDSFYSKKEPAKKVGAEVWVMVIHAVIFALFGIGALIAAVVSLVLLFTSGQDSEGALTTLLSSLIIAGYYALTFLRTLNPNITRWLQRWYKMIMLVSVGIIALLGIVGPMAQERATRDDRLISSELSSLSTAVSTYARQNDKLPENLNQLELRGDTKKLVEKNLVRYKPEFTASTIDLGSSSKLSQQLSSLNNISRNEYRYQLCVTFKEESDGYSRYTSYTDYDDEEYDSYASAYEHPAGEVCYKLKTTEF